MSATIKMKRGDSFGVDGLLKLNGAEVDLTAYSIRSQIRNQRSTFICVLTVAKQPQGGALRGQYTIDAAYGDTEKWAPGTYFCDVEFTLGGVRVSTDTVNVRVGEDYTR